MLSRNVCEKSGREKFCNFPHCDLIRWKICREISLEFDTNETVVFTNFLWKSIMWVKFRNFYSEDTEIWQELWRNSFHENSVLVNLFYYLKPIQFLKWVEKETFVRFTVSRVDEQKVESKFFRSGRFLTLTCASSLTVAPQKRFRGLHYHKQFTTLYPTFSPKDLHSQAKSGHKASP